jgi:hypothetical protein
MKQPSIDERIEYDSIVNNRPSEVRIAGRKRPVRLYWLKPYTLERLTEVWLERDMASAKIESDVDVAKDMLKEPYFAFKEAALMMLNHDIKIRLFYPLLWRHLARRYSEEQIAPIVAAGKKKLPLVAHYEIMAYSQDMRTDMIKMTKMEAEQYQAERLSALKQLSLKSSPLMGALAGVLGAGSAISGTGASSPAPK